MDDPYISCPYNKQHRVPRSRMQAHIVKCQKNSVPLKICPYNATHRYPEISIKEHCVNCPDKDAQFPGRVSRNKDMKGSITTPTPILQNEYLPETDPNHECWDD